MSPNRRTFLRLSALAGSSLGLGLFPGAAISSDATDGARGSIGLAAKPLRLLILGGTGFTGPHQVRYAVSRGHTVTVFNLGETHPGQLPSAVEKLIGDRNGQMDVLKGRTWDVCIDIPTTLPVWVRDAARILKGNVGRYVFISTISVYSDNSKPGMNEDGPLAKYAGADPMKETQASLGASNYALYGPLKVRSEMEVEKWFPGNALIIRPGLIVGPGDGSDRFTYWPVRIARGGEVLAPGDPSDPVQFIDARDLAEWTIRMVEQGQVGTYNATGPKSKLSIGEMLTTIRTTTASQAKLTWVGADFLSAHNVNPWSDMPVWVPPRGDEAGFSQISNEKAVSNGLTFRSVADTTQATLEWFRRQPAERQATLRAGLKPDREKEVLALWHGGKT